MSRWTNILNAITGKSEARAVNPYERFFNGYAFDSNNVDVKSVSGIATWWRGTQILSNVIAGLPKHLVQYKGDDRLIVKDSPSVPLITDMANVNLDSYAWHDYIMQSVLNYGNGYSLIGRDSNARPTSLTVVHPDKVKVYVYSNAVVYEIKGSEGEEPLKVLYDDMYHIKGLTHNAYTGISPISAHATSLGATISAQKYGKNSYDKGFLSTGYIKMPGTLTAEVMKTLRTSWASRNSGVDNMGTSILDNGTEYVPLSMSMIDAQYIETRRFQKSEIATILGIPTHLINEMGDAKYNNVENTNTQFVQYTIMSYVHKFEQENKKLLRADQRGSLSWKYNVNGLMRGDMAARSAFYSAGIQNSWLKPSEARSLEDMTGGIDDYMISANNQIPYEKLDEVLNNKKGGTNG